MLGMMLLLVGCGDKDTEETGGDDTAAEEVDADGDGYTTADDCDDDNADINPDAEEVCDGIDNDCDTRIDDGLTSAYFTDSDGDGIGAYGDVLYACEDPGAGYSLESGDCDDSDSSVYPGAEEICDGVDNDCGGVADDDLLTTWYLDFDGDGYGDGSTGTDECESPGEDYVEEGGDCDDDNDAVYPDAEELCDGIDNNCAVDLAEATWTPDDGSEQSDLTAIFNGGTDKKPAEITLPEAGTLTLCEGEAHALITIGGDVVITGAYGAEATVLSGAEVGGVLTIDGEYTAIIEGITVLDGMAEWGGGLAVSGGADVLLGDVIFEDNTASTGGGAIYVASDSAVSGSGVTFDGNSPDDISRGTKKSYSADKKGSFDCTASSKICD